VLLLGWFKPPDAVTAQAPKPTIHPPQERRSLSPQERGSLAALGADDVLGRSAPHVENLLRCLVAEASVLRNSNRTSDRAVSTANKHKQHRSEVAATSQTTKAKTATTNAVASPKEKGIPSESLLNAEPQWNRDLATRGSLDPSPLWSPDD
jgi:hypothetical protein